MTIDLGVDQSLANSGIVLMECAEVPKIISKTMLRSTTLLDSSEATLRRAEDMVEEFRLFLGDHSHIVRIDLIIHETPPRANQLQRPESSLLAALALRLAAKPLGLSYTSVTANAAKKHFTGSGNATKAKMRERMWERYPEFKTFKLNEHQADAAALVVTYRYPDV
jgi:Holliday junction resolvasome RuvABC endonuclease subunit